MAIEFACPNGHKLSSPEENGGRMVKCPRCGAATLVPKSGGSGKNVLTEAAPPSGGSGSNKAAKSASDSAKGISNGAAPSDSAVKRQARDAAVPDSSPNVAAKSATADEQIMFLCPNGHKLNAPKRLQGHAGQCPHCKATFRIPMFEQATANQVGDKSGERTADKPTDKAQVATESDEFTVFEHGLLEAAGNGQGETYDMLSAVLSDPPPGGSMVGIRTEGMPANAHPLARLVARLWSEREHGGIVELHLTGGALLVPEWFDVKLSHDSHGLFAVQAADGSVTMTIVPWETVARVVVRGVIGLPDGLFE